MPAKVQVKIDGSNMTAKGPKGELGMTIPENIQCNIDNGIITFSRTDDAKHNRAIHGLTRALFNNIIEGVTNGFTRTMLIEGVGYKAEARSNKLLLSMGYSHPIVVIPPDGVSFEVPNATTIKVSGIDKQIVGQVCAKIRSIRPPEPYKGKGIRYENEYVRRKAGKTAA